MNCELWYHQKHEMTPLESCAWIIGYIDPSSAYQNIDRIQDSKSDGYG